VGFVHQVTLPILRNQYDLIRRQDGWWPELVSVDPQWVASDTGQQIMSLTKHKPQTEIALASAFDEILNCRVSPIPLLESCVPTLIPGVIIVSCNFAPRRGLILSHGQRSSEYSIAFFDRFGMMYCNAQ
jgi:hypothetical protein